MLEIVYPENGEKYANGEFHSTQDCKDFIQNLTKKWNEIKPSGDDKGAFICPYTGTIIVIREAAQQRVKRTGYVASSSVGEKCGGCNEYDCRCADYAASSLR